jgi:hypothetical protein
MDYKLIEEAAREWEDYARELDAWRQASMRQATRGSSREARNDARRLRRLLPLVGIEVSLVRPNWAQEEDG